jgi:hypothetical protein
VGLEEDPEESLRPLQVRHEEDRGGYQEEKGHEAPGQEEWEVEGDEAGQEPPARRRKRPAATPLVTR